MSRWIAVAALAAMFSTGCQSSGNHVAGGRGGMDKTANGAGLGAAAGAITGAIIGHQTGNTGAGALIGAAAGGLGGGLIGNNMDRTEERDEAIAQANYAEASRQADARALSNGDVIYMAQQQVSDRIIIASIQNRGGRFAMDAQSVVHLQKSGVSDDVIQCMYRYSN